MIFHFQSLKEILDNSRKIRRSQNSTEKSSIFDQNKTFENNVRILYNNLKIMSAARVFLYVIFVKTTFIRKKGKTFELKIA